MVLIFQPKLPAGWRPRIARRAQHPLFISRIEVEGLFGQFNYDLHCEGANLSKLLILYGDNGSGKTTILKSIFHFLSPATNRGRRGTLARIPFKLISVTLGQDTVVAVKRPAGNLVGAYEMSIRTGSSKSSKSLSIEVEVDANLNVPSPLKNSNLLFGELASLGLGLHFLSDDRKIITDLAPDETEEETPRSRY
jgi:energy-coupling factor transporter ATP-binding protein EcfA2